MLFDLSRAVLTQLDPERAHELTLAALERGIHPKLKHTTSPALETDLFGARLPNPVGVAAGFDKDARVPDALLNIGFGFAEVGTLTPQPQAGNQKPRVFRLKPDRAIINRNGFNNGGHAAAKARLAERDRVGCVGVNLGANKTSTDRVADYVAGVTTFYDDASYFMVNVSSPNTPGLRDLQAPDAIGTLLDAVTAARDARADRSGRRVPIAVKLAPDIADDDLAPILDVLLGGGADAVAISNTTITRPASLSSDAAVIAETGGLSGAPLFERSTAVLARAYAHVGSQMALIGIGGIQTGQSAVDKIRAGATAIQLYTGLVYGGPEVLANITDALERAVRAEGVASVGDLVGTSYRDWL
ncbi:MAG: quinone-dependent dihydroorotate dehydrogenase [Pseudomonadota bacterium]